MPKAYILRALFLSLAPSLSPCVFWLGFSAAARTSRGEEAELFRTRVHVTRRVARDWPRDSKAAAKKFARSPSRFIIPRLPETRAYEKQGEREREEEERERQSGREKETAVRERDVHAPQRERELSEERAFSRVPLGDDGSLRCVRGHANATEKSSSSASAPTPRSGSANQARKPFPRERVARFSRDSPRAPQRGLSLSLVTRYPLLPHDPPVRSPFHIVYLSARPRTSDSRDGR